jgi:hypothetical protein
MPPITSHSRASRDEAIIKALAIYSSDGKILMLVDLRPSDGHGNYVAVPVESQYCKNSRKRCPVFRPAKLFVNLPALPRTSPRFHHKSTTARTRFFQKTPEKRLIHHKGQMREKDAKSPRPSPWF